jgi:hypothetical protein
MVGVDAEVRVTLGSTVLELATQPSAAIVKIKVTSTNSCDLSNISNLISDWKGWLKHGLTVSSAGIHQQN